MLLVDDALEPVIHTVGPETTLGEILEIIVGKRVGAVPVVGQRSEVLGIVTSGDALDQLMRGSPSEDDSAEERLTARDIMTRTVLCVSEGQPLFEAAQMMVNKRIEQLPVTREGELIGIVTRSKVLRALHGERKAEQGDGSDGA
ncbi:MAG TPA: CBS domain-containing protein [Longimicrobiales bacterium]|nr:CBS domain-containing protein [Longimicrobiales bacterium]